MYQVHISILFYNTDLASSYASFFMAETHANNDNQPPIMDRRTILKLFGAGAYGISNLDQILKQAQEILSPEHPQQHRDLGNATTSPELPTPVSDGIGQATAAVFLGFIAAATAGKAQPDFLKTALPFAGAELLRQQVLQHEDPRKADEAQSDFITSAVFTAGFTGLVDAISKIKIDPDRFGESLTNLQEKLLHGEKPSSQLPSLEHESIENCEALLQQERARVVKLLAIDSAIATVIAPLATTYASAQSSSQLLEHIAHSLTKAYYAQTVIEIKKEKKLPKNMTLLEYVRKRSQAALTGPLGLAKLQMTNHANIKGLPMGDPPNYYSLLRNPSLVHTGLVVGQGGVLSEALEVTTNLLWLKSTGLFDGADMKNYASQFATNQGQTFQELAKIFKSIDATFRGFKGNANTLAKELLRLTKPKASEHDILAVTEHLNRLQFPLFAANYSGYLEGKAKKLFTAAKKGLGKLNKIFDHQIAAIASPTLALPEIFATDTYDTSLLGQFIKDLMSNPHQNIDDIQSAMEKLGSQVTDKTALRNVLESLWGIPSTEAEKDDLLSPAAKEAGATLATQLSAVPSLVRTTELTIDRLQQNTIPTKESVQRLTMEILTATAVFSGIADNAAAYLFGSQLIERYYKKAYGSDVLKNNPLLAEFADIAAITAAVAGGGLSLHGNAPNFLTKSAEVSIENTGIVTIDTSKHIELGPSFVNAFASTQVAALLGVLAAEQAILLPEIPQAPQQTTTRRRFLFG